MIYSKEGRVDNKTTFGDLDCGQVFLLDSKGSPYLKIEAAQDEWGAYSNAVSLVSGGLYEYNDPLTVIVPKYEFKIFD